LIGRPELKFRLHINHSRLFINPAKALKNVAPELQFRAAGDGVTKKGLTRDREGFITGQSTLLPQGGGML
jgi:hypothetical protein